MFGEFGDVKQSSGLSFFVALSILALDHQLGHRFHVQLVTSSEMWTPLVHLDIYIYIDTSLSLSLSVFIYLFIYLLIYLFIDARFGLARSCDACAVCQESAQLLVDLICELGQGIM